VRRLAWIVALIAALVVACVPGPGTGGMLEGPRWVLRSFASDGAQVLLTEDEYADAEFTGGRVQGFGGCSHYDAIARATGRTLLISSPATTLQSCGEAADAFQSTYLGLLDQSRHYRAREGSLTIFGADGSTLLTFDAGPRNPLLGAWQVESFATAPGSQTAPLEGTTLTATFRLTDVGGSAGCNTYDGTYSTNGKVVRIGRLATTRMACEQDVMDQETAFLAALEGVAFVEPRGTTLLLTDRNGNIDVVLVRPGEDGGASPPPSSGPTVSPTPSATPTASPSPSPSPTRTPRPTPSPTPTPTATASPTPPPTASPTAAPTAAPTVAPPSPLPETATCAIDGAGGAMADIVYPADWYTLDSPAGLACRYFDPAPITVPPDPLDLQTAVMIELSPSLDYEDAVTAATDPGTWDVTTQSTFTVAGYPATLVAATSTNAASGYPVGTGRYAYILDLGANGSVAIATTSADGAPPAGDTSTVDLIAAESTVSAPS
jgi:heat shock protein HslJ